VAWHSIRVAPLDDGIYARIVTGAGAPTTVKTIAHYDWWTSHMPVDVACGVTGLLMENPHYLVTWDSALDFNGSTYAREMSVIGSLRDAVEIDMWSGPAAVAGGSINHLVAWDTNGTDSDGFSDIYAGIVGNTRPVAKFTVNPTEGNSATAFQFDATTSGDWTDRNEQLQVRWDWDNDGSYDTPWTHTRTASHQFVLEPWTSLEVKIVRLEVTDGHEVSDTTSRDISVRNASPTAAFTVSPSSGDTGTSFVFDASASRDPEDGTLHALWDWEDDGTFDTTWSEDLTATHTFPAPGTYTIRFNLGNNWEQIDTVTRQVQVQPGSANTPPQAAFTVTPPSGDASTVFAFEASASADAEDGSPPEVRWDWNNDGDFETAWSTTRNAQHTFSAVGNHTVRLEVRDSGGLTDDATQTVPVGGGPLDNEIYLPLSLRTSG
jgi:PKD repeat protein